MNMLQLLSLYPPLNHNFQQLFHRLLLYLLQEDQIKNKYSVSLLMWALWRDNSYWPRCRTIFCNFTFCYRFCTMIILHKVVLPVPFKPNKPTDSPSSKRKLHPSKLAFSPKHSVEFLAEVLYFYIFHIDFLRKSSFK